MNKPKTKQVTAYIPETLYKAYSIRYPHTFSTFIRNCVVKSVRDKEFFKSILFDVLPYNPESDQ